MIRKVLLHYTFVEASCTALFLFLAVFIGTLLWVYRRGSNETYQNISKLPLEE